MYMHSDVHTSYLFYKSVPYFAANSQYSCIELPSHVQVKDKWLSQNVMPIHHHQLSQSVR